VSKSRVSEEKDKKLRELPDRSHRYGKGVTPFVKQEIRSRGIDRAR